MMQIRTVSQLRKELEKVFNSCFTDLMEVTIKDKIIQNGIGFFPYGSGLLSSDIENLPQNGILFVGQDFGTERYLTPEIIKNGEIGNRTYSNLVNFIPENLKTKCFLTNLFIGLRKPPAKMMGKNPVLSDLVKNKDYISACFAFLETQIEATKPKLIVFLGTEPFKATLNFYNLGTFSTFKEYYSGSQNHYLTVSKKQYKIIAIPHPCNWHFNFKPEQKQVTMQYLESVISN